jgi:CheY-like chemotaxis protein
MTGSCVRSSDIAPRSSPAPRDDHPSDLDRRTRVLVVEDHIDLANVLRLTLESMGFEVYQAHDGEAAFVTACTVVPDYILLDLGLPTTSGYQVAELLRGRPELEKTVLIALTGREQGDDPERATAAGFKHYLKKPVDLDALEKLLASGSIKHEANVTPRNPS